jgi:DNA-binding transcriptional LysR family regulator
MRFDLTDLQLFVHAVESGSITAGARRANLALPSASARLRGMEALAGVPLLLRGPRGVVPTPAGRTVLHHARLVRQQVRELHGDLARQARGLRVTVRIAANTTALGEWLPAPLGAFLARHPQVDAVLEERSSHAIPGAVAQGQADLGVAAQPAGGGRAPDFDGALRYRPFRHDPLVLAVPAGHPLARDRGPRDFADALDCRFVGLAPGSALQAHVAAQAERAGRPLAYRVRAPDADAALRLVAAGAGIAVLPRAALDRHAAAGGVEAVALADDWAERRLQLCLPAETATLPVAALLAEALAPAAEVADAGDPAGGGAPGHGAVDEGAAHGGDADAGGARNARSAGNGDRAARPGPGLSPPPARR